jgi:hypothetical protein
MGYRDAATRAGMILVFAAGLSMAGCQGQDAGMIAADRGKAEQLYRANSDRPGPPSPSKPPRTRVDYNDISPRTRVGEIQR